MGRSCPKNRTFSEGNLSEEMKKIERDGLKERYLKNHVSPKVYKETSQLLEYCMFLEDKMSKQEFVRLKALWRERKK